MLSRGFIKRESKKLVPTQAGLSVYKLTHNELIGKILLTAEFEEKLKLISSGDYLYSNFLSEISALAATSILAVHTNDIDASALAMTSQTDNEQVICPKCKKGSITENEKAFGCNQWKSGCDFKIWKSFMGRTLTGVNVKDLIIKGKTRKMTFKSQKTGNEYEACAVMKNGRVILEFVETKNLKYEETS